jgi:hypothetical protein
MSDPHRPTEVEVVMRNAHTDPPHIGAVVHCLNHGGAMSYNVTWTRDSIKYYDGWHLSLKVPREIKEIQMARFKEKTDGDITSGAGTEKSANQEAADAGIHE